MYTLRWIVFDQGIFSIDTSRIYSLLIYLCTHIYVIGGWKILMNNYTKVSPPFNFCIKLKFKHRNQYLGQKSVLMVTICPIFITFLSVLRVLFSLVINCGAKNYGNKRIKHSLAFLQKMLTIEPKYWLIMQKYFKIGWMKKIVFSIVDFLPFSDFAQ